MKTTEIKTKEDWLVWAKWEMFLQWGYVLMSCDISTIRKTLENVNMLNHSNGNITGGRFNEVEKILSKSTEFLVKEEEDKANG